MFVPKEHQLPRSFVPQKYCFPYAQFPFPYIMCRQFMYESCVVRYWIVGSFIVSSTALHYNNNRMLHDIKILLLRNNFQILWCSNFEPFVTGIWQFYGLNLLHLPNNRLFNNVFSLKRSYPKELFQWSMICIGLVLLIFFLWEGRLFWMRRKRFLWVHNYT